MLRSLPTTPSAVPTDLPDRVAMEAVVTMVTAGKFHAGQGQVGFEYRADLPQQFADLSLDGSISIITHTETRRSPWSSTRSCRVGQTTTLVGYGGRAASCRPILVLAVRRPSTGSTPTGSGSWPTDRRVDASAALG
jgi:hypothetical protein